MERESWDDARMSTRAFVWVLACFLLSCRSTEHRATPSEVDLDSEVADALTLLEEEFRRGVKLAHEAGLEILNCIMLGFYWDTPETLKQSLDLAFQLDAEFTQFSIPTPLPGTEYYQLLKQNGLRIVVARHVLRHWLLFRRRLRGLSRGFLSRNDSPRRWWSARGRLCGCLGRRWTTRWRRCFLGALILDLVLPAFVDFLLYWFKITHGLSPSPYSMTLFSGYSIMPVAPARRNAGISLRA